MLAWSRMSRLLTSRPRRRLAVRLAACCPVTWHRRVNWPARTCRRPKVTWPRAELRDSGEGGGTANRTNSAEVEVRLKLLGPRYFPLCHSHPAPAGGVLSVSWCCTACSRTSSRLRPARGGWRWSPSRFCPRAPRIVCPQQTHCWHNPAGKHMKQHQENTLQGIYKHK